MYRRDVLRVATAGGAVASAGCNGGPNVDGDDDEDRRVRIVDHELVRRDENTEEETVSVVGELERVDDDDEIRYVELRAEFLDEDGEPLDTTTERVQEVEPEDRWTFEVVAPFQGERAAAVRSYDVVVATVL